MSKQTKKPWATEAMDRLFAIFWKADKTPEWLTLTDEEKAFLTNASVSPTSTQKLNSIPAIQPGDDRNSPNTVARVIAVSEIIADEVHKAATSRE